MSYVVFWTEREQNYAVAGSCVSERDRFEIHDSENAARLRWRQVIGKDNTVCAGWTPISGEVTEPHWIETNSDFD